MKKSMIQKVLSMILAVFLMLSILPMNGIAQSSIPLRYGDVNSDGEINAKDALEVLKAVVNKITLNNQQTQAADVEGNGTLNASDALYILKYSVGKIEKFPVEIAREEADKAAAQSVDSKITAIGVVTLDSQAAIDEARAAYESLTDQQKELVTKLDVLTSAEETLEQLKEQPVVFDVYVTHATYGAKGDGVTNDRAAIQAAIDAAYAAGGGTVRLDAGKTFVSSNLLLRSNVTLFFEDGSKLLQSGNPKDFVDPLNNFESRELIFGQYVNPDIQWDAAAFYNYPLIQANKGTENIKITGKGTIEMNAGNDSRGMMTMQAIGLFGVNNYELSDFTVRKYYAYCIKAVSCSNGLYKNLTIDITGGILGGTDGINLTGCRDIRVTGCNINSGDDGIYIGSDYKDPRTGLWYNCDNLSPIQNIEIDNNHCEVVWDETKAFCFIMWGSQYPDQSQVEVSNIYIHDNYFESIGAWTGNWDLETQKFDFNGSANPMKNIRFENNTIDRVQSSFYTLPISDVYGFDCMTAMKNGDFATKDIYWVSRLQNSQASAGAQQNLDKENDWYGYIRDLNKGDAALYQGLKLQTGRNYCLKAMVQTSGDPVRLFVKDQITQELIASQEICNIQWEEVSLTFQVPADGNYHIGIERGNATKGWACIDSVSCEVVINEEPLDGYTIFSDEVPEGVADGGFKNQYGTIFLASTDGIITKVRIYTSERETGIHYVSLWDYKAKKMLTEEFYEWEVVPGYTGWQTYTLPIPVSIQANTEYVVAVSAGDDRLTCVTKNNQAAFSSEYLTAPIDCAVSTRDAINGFFEMPDDRYSNNVFRDVVFVPDEESVVDPADQAAAIAVDEAIIAIGTVTLESEAAIASARSAYDALTDAQKALVTKLYVLVTAEQTLKDLQDAAETPVGESIFTDQVPATTAGDVQQSYGTVFSADVNGTVTKVRIYTTAGETGTHYVAIWDYETGTMVTAEMYAWNIQDGYTGWQTFELPQSVSIVAGKQYVVSVSSGPDGIVSLTTGTTGFANGHLSTPAKSGVSSRDYNLFLTQMPDDAYLSNVFRDVVFVPTSK